MTKQVDAPPPDKWPKGKYVCTKCEKQKKAADFAWETTVCYMCGVDADRDRLASDMAARKAEHEVKRLAELKRRSIAGGRKRGKQKTQEAKDRKKAIADAKKKLKQNADVVAKQLKPQAMAERELASRTLARRSLLHYTERNVPGYDAGWVHEDICRRLEKFMRDVEEKKSPRLMLWVPPRHGKSELASIQFPSWVLGQHPDWEFISASYTVDLPVKFSRKIRAQINSSEYKALFPKTLLAKDSQAAEDWLTTKGGGYRASGVSGGITGMGAHIFGIDDPVKDQEDADSETSRAKVWNWFGSTAYTRLAPGGGMLVIQTRWHDDDLSGHLERNMKEALKELEELRATLKEATLKAKTAEDKRDVKTLAQHVTEFSTSIDRWEIVKYPAIATEDEFLDTRTGKIQNGANRSTDRAQRAFKKLRKKGEPLHPARWGLTLLNRIKRTLQPRHWSALYQQNPTPDEGMFFTKDMVRYRPTLPDVRKMYRFAAWDLAIGQRTSSDWTVGVVGALDWDENLWIVDLVRGKWNTHQIAENIIALHKRYNLVQTGIEKGQLELAIKPHLTKLMQKGGKHIALAEGKEALNPITDKIVRARPLQGRMQQGSVIFPMDQPWAEDLVSELLRFPSGLHDDRVDAMAWLVRMVLRHGKPMKPKENTGVRGLPTWKDRLSGIIGNSKHFMSR